MKNLKRVSATSAFEQVFEFNFLKASILNFDGGIKVMKAIPNYSAR